MAEQVDSCLLDTSGFVVVCHSEPQGILCEHFPILITEQVVLWLPPPDSHVFRQNHKHLRAERADLNPPIFCVAIHHLPTIQVHIPVLDVPKGRRTAAGVQKIIDNDPVAIFAELTVFPWASHKSRQFRIGVCFLDRFLLFQIWDNHIRQSFTLAPPQEGIHHPQISGDGIVGKSGFPHGDNHLLQVSFGQFRKGHFNVEMFPDPPQMVVVI